MRLMISIPSSLSLSSAPAKQLRGCQIRVPRSLHSLNQRCPIQSRLQSVLGVGSSYVERNKDDKFLMYSFNLDYFLFVLQNVTAYFPTQGMVTAVYVMRPQASVPVNQRLVEDNVTDVMKMPTIRAEDVLVSVHLHVGNCSFQSLEQLSKHLSSFVFL